MNSDIETDLEIIRDKIRSIRSQRGSLRAADPVDTLLWKAELIIDEALDYAKRRN